MKKMIQIKLDTLYITSMEELRKIQEARYLAQLAKEREKADADEALKKAEEMRIAEETRRNFLLEKYARLFSMNYPSEKSAMIGRFLRRWISKNPLRETILIHGERYPFAVALELSDNDVPPFDTQWAKNEINAYFRRETNLERYLGMRLSQEQEIEFMLIPWINQNRSKLTWENCIIPCVDDGLFDFLAVSDPQEFILRFPFAPKDDKHQSDIAFWFCVFIACQIIPIPNWIGSNQDYLMSLAEEKIKDGIDSLGKRHQAMMEILNPVLPDPNDICRCPGCDTSIRFRSMYSRPGGSIYFCRYCAIGMGIDVNVLQSSQEILDEINVDSLSDIHSQVEEPIEEFSSDSE